MPYVMQDVRDILAHPDNRPSSTGELTYVFYREALRYLGTCGVGFATMSEIVAAFECAKLEFYRRHVAPYEDKKIAGNGDVT